ncbi:hypothetical protein [Microbacterium jiangjiandongii]|uniref:hypothetical protein n=1 Tax=Microbacterium jiangjiandongii TaxID=3049071 RepID=UPI00214BE4A8|nr:hypothetical protein [Microbacterium sp. zg.Y843]MCR2814912.1 hypothetical protein [Microbacterium sp. zg.Y843]
MRAGRQATVAAAMGLLLLTTGCNGDPVTPPAPPDPTESTESPEPPEPLPDPPTPDDALVISQDGLAQFAFHRDVLDLSVTEVEEVLGTSFLAPQTEHCSLAIWESEGIAAAVDAGSSGIMAFVTDRSDVVSSAGIRIGDPLDAVIEAHGEEALEAYEQPLTPSGGMVVAVVDDSGATEGSMHLAYELGPDSRVARIRGGFAPFSLYADYCSDAAVRPDATGWPL